MQNLFAKARSEASRGKAPRHPGWFITVARNELASQARERAKEDRHAAKLLRHQQASQPRKDPLRVAVDKEEIAALRWARAQLSPEYQLVLKLRYDDDCDRRAIAAIIGRSPDSVRGLLQRALAALRKLVDETG